MIERSTNPLDRLRVVHPNPPRSGLVTERELAETRAWATVGRALTCGVFISAAVYIAFALGAVPW